MCKPRMMCSFSCGAASAVATKIALNKYKDTHEIFIVRFVIDDEHPDNERFHTDCELKEKEEPRISVEIPVGIRVMDCQECKKEGENFEIAARDEQIKNLQAEIEELKSEIVKHSSLSDEREKNIIELGCRLDDERSTVRGMSDMLLKQGAKNSELLGRLYTAKSLLKSLGYTETVPGEWQAPEPGDEPTGDVRKDFHALFTRYCSARRVLEFLGYEYNAEQDKWQAPEPTQPQAGEWIPVCERLPERDGVYLISRKSNLGIRQFREMARYSQAAQHWQLDNGAIYHKTVTHWMPLPPFPATEGA